MAPNTKEGDRHNTSGENRFVRTATGAGSELSIVDCIVQWPAPKFPGSWEQFLMKRVIFQISALDPGIPQGNRGINPMAHPDLVLTTAQVAGIAEPHRSTVAAILRATEQGLFSAAEAQLMIDRVRTQGVTSPLPTSGLPSTGSGQTSGAGIQYSPDRTVT
jgi:hypothetical protein